MKFLYNLTATQIIVHKIGSRGVAETGSSIKAQIVDGSSRTMNCRLSGTWRATSAVWANNSELPNIGEMYDTMDKSSYSGARASITTTAGGTIFVFCRWILLDMQHYRQGLMMDNPMKILFIMQFNLKTLQMDEYQI